MPVKEVIALKPGEELRTEYFLERREMGVINIGGTGKIIVDDRGYVVGHKEGMYFDMPEDAFVMHYMGEPTETRHIVVRNEQAVISPSRSIHSGRGSRNYPFIWGMVGENQDFDDMDAVANQELM